MTAKHQITIPKKIAAALELKKGSLFNIEVSNNRIELVPLEISKKTITREMYRKLEAISKKEQGQEKKITRSLIGKIRENQDVLHFRGKEGPMMTGAASS